MEVIRAEPASLWRRAGAWLVDAIVVGLFLLAYLEAAKLMMHHPPPETAETGLDWLVNRVDAYQGVLKYGLLLVATVGFLYSALFHAWLGRTLGKWIFRIKLVDASGQAPSLARCVVRALASVGSIALLFLGVLYAAFSRRRRAFHDVLAGTYVVRPLQARPHG